MQKPHNPVLRFVVIAAAVLWLGHMWERPIVESSLPVLRCIVSTFANDFKILSLTIAHEGPNDTVEIRADYAHTLAVGGWFVHPINPDHLRNGWLQVNLTIGGLVQYELLMLIVVLAWPAKNGSELVRRIAISLPLVLVLFLVTASSTLCAELWSGLHTNFAPHEFWPLLGWSKFLMGGGGAMLAIALAILCIELYASNGTT